MAIPVKNYREVVSTALQVTAKDLLNSKNKDVNLRGRFYEKYEELEKGLSRFTRFTERASALLCGCCSSRSMKQEIGQAIEDLTGKAPPLRLQLIGELFDRFHIDRKVIDLSAADQPAAPVKAVQQQPPAPLAGGKPKDPPAERGSLISIAQDRIDRMTPQQRQAYLEARERNGQLNAVVPALALTEGEIVDLRAKYYQRKVDQLQKSLEKELPKYEELRKIIDELTKYRQVVPPDIQRAHDLSKTRCQELIRPINLENLEHEFQIFLQNPRMVEALRESGAINVQRALTKSDKAISADGGFKLQKTSTIGVPYISFSSNSHYYIARPPLDVIGKSETQAKRDALQQLRVKVQPDTEAEQTNLGILRYDERFINEYYPMEGASFKSKDPTTSEELILNKESFCEFLMKQFPDKHYLAEEVERLLEETLLTDGVNHIGDLSSTMLNIMNDPRTFRRNGNLTSRPYNPNDE